MPAGRIKDIIKDLTNEKTTIGNKGLTMASDNLSFFPRDPRWSDSIPLSVRKEMAFAIRSEFHKLPPRLRAEWQSSRYLDKNFFMDAGLYINIPHP